jgi:hypothetical protein
MNLASRQYEDWWPDIQMATTPFSNGLENGGELNDHQEWEAKFYRWDREVSNPLLWLHES